MLILLVGFVVLNLAFLGWVFLRIARELKSRRQQTDRQVQQRRDVEPRSRPVEPRPADQTVIRPPASAPAPRPSASAPPPPVVATPAPLPPRPPVAAPSKPKPVPQTPQGDTMFGDYVRAERDEVIEAERNRAEEALAERRRAEEAQRRRYESERQAKAENQESRKREAMREAEAAMRRSELDAATEAVNEALSIDPNSAEAKRLQGAVSSPFIEVPVFYGTNRSKAEKGVWYGVERGEMRFGRCLVTVPTDRRIGTIPRPTIWTLYREKPDQHYILANVEESSGKDAFSRNLREYVQHCAKRQVLVFVHGFNVMFADAVYRTAQIASDLDFQGVPILFSWPSKGTLHPLGYTHDETQARWALPDLRAFLELVAEQSGADAIHLLAHSMGNRALTEALGQIAASAAMRSRAPFNELMLTAPDIDADTFVRDIAPAMRPASARVTLYASSNDRALAFSKTVHGYPRAGESGDGIVLIDGIDTIDVSAVDTNFVGHFYYGDNRSVLSDLFHLMQGQLAEQRFGLRLRQKNARPYWVFQP